MSPRIALTCLLGLLIHAVSGQRGYFDQHPELGIQLGRGFTWPDTRAAQSAFLNVAACGLTTDQPGRPNSRVQSALHLSFIRSRKDLNNMFSADAYLRASYLSQSLSAKYGITESTVLNEQAMTFAVKTSTRYQPEYLGPLVFINEADALRKADFAAFTNEYGTHYVSGMQRGLDLAVFITLNFSSREEKKSVEGSVDFKGGSAIFKGAAGASFNKKLNELNENGALNIQISARGGVNPFVGLQNLIRLASSQPNALQEILGTISTYMSQFDDSTSFVARYYYAPMPNPTDPKPAIINAIPREKLGMLIDEYDELSQKYDAAVELHKSSMFKETASAQDRTELSHYVSTLRGMTDSLEASLFHCKDISSADLARCKCCGTPLFDTRNAVYDKYNTELERLEFYLEESNFHVRHGTMMVKRRGYLPYLHGRTLRLKLRSYLMPYGVGNKDYGYKAIFSVNGTDHELSAPSGSNGWRYEPLDVEVTVPQDGKIEYSLFFDHGWATGVGDPLDGLIREGSLVDVEFVR